MRLCNVVLILVLIFPALSKSLTVSQEKLEETPKAWGLGTSVSLNSTVDKPDAFEHSVASSVTISPSYKLSKHFTLMGNFGVVKNLDGLLEERLQNGFVGLSFPLAKHQQIVTVGGSLRAYLPLDEDNRDFDTFRTAVQAGTNTNVDLKVIGLKYVSLSYGNSLTRNVFKYKQDRRGGPNRQYVFTNSLALTYTPKEKLSFSMSFANTHSWSYSNNRLADMFSIGQSISYAVTPQLSIAVGHTNGGTTFTSNGVDPNVKLFYDYTSMVYSSLAYRF